MAKPKTGPEPKENFSTGNYERTGDFGTITAADIEAYQRGIAWLQREIPSLQDFARAWTGKKIKVQVGPMACTDGSTIFLRPPKLGKGEAEPDRTFMALLYHEIAHCLITDVYDPPSSRKIQDAMKYRADKDYGQPGGWVWNALEDGRVEEWLYRTAPGARKHIRKMLEDIQESTLKMLHDPEPPRTRQQAEDIGMLLGAYYESAGHRDIVERFPQRIVEALADPEIKQIVHDVHKARNSKEILTDHTQPFMRRARELGFFADHDPRSIDPETGQPKNVDWDELSEEEKEQIRQQMRDALKGKQPDKPEPGEDVTGVEIPEEEIKDLLDELTEEEKQELAKNAEPSEEPSPLEREDETGEAKPDKKSEADPKSESGAGSEEDDEPEGDEPSDDEFDEDLDDEDLEGGEPGDESGDEPGDGPDGSESESESGEAGSDSEPVPGEAGSEGESESGESENGAEGDGTEEGETDGSGAGESELDGDGAGSGSDGPDGAGAGDRPDPAGDPEAGGDELDDESDEDFDDESDEDFDEDGESGSGSGVGTPSGMHSEGSDDPSESGDLDGEGEAGADEAAGDTGDGEGGGDGVLEEHDGLDPEEVEQAAREEHERREAERIERVKEFERAFEEIEETMRPPHNPIKEKSELTYSERNDPEAKVIEKAQELEVGHVWGDKRDSSKFLYREHKVRGVGNTTGKDLMNQFADTISGNLNRLRAVFKQNRKSGFAGRYEIGQHVSQRALTGFMMKEHFKPFDRRVIPKRTSYAVTLLIDQSGSMRYDSTGYYGYGYGRAPKGSKIVMARTAVAMQAEMLDRLQIPFEVLGFTTGHSDVEVKHSVFKSFEESWGTETINRVLGIEAESGNLDGLALAWSWERLAKRREQVKILITYSDGQPAPDTENQTRIMKWVIRKMQQAGAVAIGVGIQTTAVDRLYPKVVHCSDLRALPKQMVELLEKELKNK